VKAQGHKALDAIRTKVEPKLLHLVDEIVNAVNRKELDLAPANTQESSCPSTVR
jgi:hypothetical protein